MKMYLNPCKNDRIWFYQNWNAGHESPLQNVKVNTAVLSASNVYLEVTGSSGHFMQPLH